MLTVEKSSRRKRPRAQENAEQTEIVLRPPAARLRAPLGRVVVPLFFQNFVGAVEAVGDGDSCFAVGSADLRRGARATRSRGKASRRPRGVGCSDLPVGERRNAPPAKQAIARPQATRSSPRPGSFNRPLRGHRNDSLLEGTLVQRTDQGRLPLPAILTRLTAAAKRA